MVSNINADAKRILNVSSLREQVYDYLHREMHDRKLLRGSFINLNEINN